MPENITNSDANNGSAPVTPTKNDSKTQDVQTIDISKLGDEEFEKFFEDPRAFKHPRFKELAESKKRARELEEDIKRRDEEALAKQGEFKELAEKRAKELDELKSEITKKNINSSIKDALLDAGINKKYLSDAVSILSNGQYEVTKEGTVLGVLEAVKTYCEARPEIIGTQNQKPSLGNPSNPVGGQGVVQFTRSQLEDPNFYKANEAAILQAFRTGQIVDDR
jgi:hypothetical protein